MYLIYFFIFTRNFHSLNLDVWEQSFLFLKRFGETRWISTKNQSFYNILTFFSFVVYSITVYWRLLITVIVLRLNRHFTGQSNNQERRLLVCCSSGLKIKTTILYLIHYTLTLIIHTHWDEFKIKHNKYLKKTLLCLKIMHNQTIELI